jgi:uncharacterized membrane protein
MSEVLLAVYRGEDTAEHLLGVLQAQEGAFTANLESLALVRLRRDSTFTVITTDPSRSTASFWGVFWEALFGLIFGVPDRPPETSSSLGQLFGTMERAGLDERFRARVRRAMRRGSSALGFFASNQSAESLMGQPFLRPQTYVCAHLLPDQDVELLKELGWSAREEGSKPAPDPRGVSGRGNHPIGVVRRTRRSARLGNDVEERQEEEQAAQGCARDRHR